MMKYFSSKIHLSWRCFIFKCKLTQNISFILAFIKFYSYIYKFFELSQVSSTRPERAEAPSPGHRPGLLWTQPCRPVRAKALKNRAIYKAFALTGRLADCFYTQGVALG